MNKIGCNLSFKGKYAVYGDKEKASRAVSNIIANKKDSVEIFPISTGNNRLVLIATDEDALTLKNKKKEVDFIDNIKKSLTTKNIVKRVSNLFKYIFGSVENAPIITDAIDKIGIRFYPFDYSSGEFINNPMSTVAYADGSYKKYGKSENIIEEGLPDGTVIKENSREKIVERPDRTYEKYSTNGKLKEAKLIDGSIEYYRHTGGKQLLLTKVFPIENDSEKPLIRNYLYNGTQHTYITESTGNIAKIDENGEEIWLDVPKEKIGDDFKEELVEPTVLIRYYTDGTAESYKNGFLYCSMSADSTKTFFDKDGLITKIKRPDGLVENYDQYGNLKSICNKYGTLLKSYNNDGKIEYEKIDEFTSKRYKYFGSETFSYVIKNNEIVEADGEINANRKEVTFRTNEGLKHIFDSHGNECIKKVAKTSKKNSDKKAQSENEEKLPIFVTASLKRGATVDKDKKTVSLLRDDGYLEVYNYTGNLLYTRTPDGDEKEYNTAGSVVAESTPFGVRTEYDVTYPYSGVYKKVIGSDGVKNSYSYSNKLLSKHFPDGTEIKYNRLGQPIEKILPNRVIGTYHYEPVTSRLLFISFTDNSVVADGGEIDRDAQTVSFPMKDGTKHIYAYSGNLIAIELKNGVRNILDENKKLKEKLYPNGTRALYNQKGVLTTKIYTNGIIEEYNQRGVITKITDSCGNTYEYFYGKLIKAPKNIFIRNQKQRNLYNSARQSLISTIAWKLSPETKSGLSEHAQGDAYLASIIEKKNYNQKLQQSMNFSRPVDYSEPMEISDKENIKYLSYLKQSWTDIGTEEFSKGLSAAYEIFRQYVESGLESIDDADVQSAVKEWVKENPDKNNVLMYSKK